MSSDRPAEHERAWLRLAPEQRGAWYGFLRTHALVVRELDAELTAAHGLTLHCYDVLLQLSLAPDGQLQMSDLAEAVLMTGSGLSRLVQRLERGGLVERRPSGVDSRVTCATLTEHGRERLAEATPTHLDGVRRRFLDRLSDEQLRQLVGIWRRVSSPVIGADDRSRKET